MRPIFYRVAQFGSGFLAVMAKPTAGDWVDEEFSGLAEADIGCVVSLLECAEAREVGLASEQAHCGAHGMEFVSYPIPDRGLPHSVPHFADFTRGLYAAVFKGRNTVVHCRAGIGRTGVVAAGILLHAAVTPKDAFDRVSAARGMQVPDTDEQYRWLEENAGSIIAR